MFTAGIKRIFNGISRFFISNLIPILFLVGIGFLVFSAFIFSQLIGFIALGISLIIIAIILALEQT